VNFVLEGEERYVIGHRTYVVKAGQFILLPAGARAQAELPSKEITRALCVYVPTNRFEWSHSEVGPPQADGQDAEEPDTCFVLNGSSSSFGRALKRISSRVAAEPALGAPWAGSVSKYIEHYLPIFSTRLSLQVDQIAASKPRTRADVLQRLERARGYLHDSKTAPVPLSTLARVAGMSQFHLSRLFKAVYGQPPAKYHRLLRLDAASARLSSGAISAEGAAEEYGYSDLPSLRRALRCRTRGYEPRNPGL
jgi:AraC-like DNA-binding protein